MAHSLLTIADIPNEILVATLSTFHTHDLLPLTLISHRFHNIVLRILHYRLLLAASNPEYKIILEAYLPSRRYTRPYLFCTYLGTDGLSSQIEGKGSLYEDLDEQGSGVGGRLGRMSGLYSRFRPELPGVEAQIPIRRIAGAAPNLQSNTSGLNMDWFNAPLSTADAKQSPAQSNSAFGTVDGGSLRESAAQLNTQQPESSQAAQQQLPQSQPLWANRGDGGSRKVVYTFNVDADEHFGQFCAIATLVQLGPRRGVFLSYVPLVEDRQCVIRIWKNWLIDRAEALIEQELEASTMEVELTKSSTNLRSADIATDKNVLWTDYKRNVGLKLAVREKNPDGPAIQHADVDKENMSLTFDIEIKELIVRTTHLMLAVEDSKESKNQPGKALIIGSFAYPAG